MKTICSIYRSRRREGLYLYVDHNDGLTRVPEPLLQQLGQLELAMTLVLKKDRQLARVDVAVLQAALQDQGYYLQMPPARDETMQQLASKNSKLQL